MFPDTSIELFLCSKDPRMDQKPEAQALAERAWGRHGTTGNDVYILGV